MKHRIDIAGGGWEYRLPFGGSVRKFDNGAEAWFFYNKKRDVQYIVLKRQPSNVEKWQVKIGVLVPKNNLYRVEFWGSGTTRREAFNELRKSVNEHRSALRKISYLTKVPQDTP